MRAKVALPMLLGAVLIVSCEDSPTTAPPAQPAAPSLSATSDWQVFPVFIDWVAYNQCLDEDIHGTGTVTWHVHVVSTPEDTRQYLFDHSRDADDWDWRLIGMTTGDIWLPLPGNRDTYITTASGDFWKWSERFVYRNQRTGAVLDWPTTVTFVIDANGQVRVDRLEGDACKLRQ